MVDSALGSIKFLNRVQQEFEPEDMTQSNIRKWLVSGKSNDLVDILALTGQVYNKAKQASSISDLRGLLQDAKLLQVYKQETIDFINKKINLAFKEITDSIIKLRSGRQRSGKIYNSNVYLIIIKTAFGEYVQARDFRTGRIVKL